MPKIVDPDLLAQGVEVDFLTGSLLIRLNYAGDLNGDGVSLQTLYSFIKEEWRTDNNLIKYPFPILSITSEQFEFINGWNLSGSVSDISASQYLLRDGGWAVVDPATGNTTEQWMNITSLGAFNNSATDQAYFYQGVGGVTSSIQLPGEVNQGIKIFQSQSFDYTDFFKIYLREPGKTYGFYDLLTEQNLSDVTYRKYALPLTNGTDLKITANDATIASTSPYTGMSIRYYTSSQAVSIGGTNYNFKVIINGNNGTAEQIYEFVQYQLRRNANIDAQGNIAGGVQGNIAEELLEFIGDTLRTKRQTDVGGTGFGGVYITNFQSADTNRLEFVDNGGTIRTFPFVAAGNLTFNSFLTSDSNAIYKVFFTNDDSGDNTGRDFGTANAIVINDNSGSPITGSVAGSGSIPFDYDYDNNIQRGNSSSGSIVPYTAVALGLSSAQYVVTTGNIIRSTTNAINFLANQERNYLNPA